MKILNLGCGNDLIRGAINVDIMEPKKIAQGILFYKEDILSFLETFPRCSMDKAIINYVLEHFSLSDAGYLIYQMNHALKIGGIVEGVTVDLDSVVSRYYPFISKSPLEKIIEINGLMFEIYDEEKVTFHKSIWCDALLDFYFNKDGFKRIEFKKAVGSREVGIYFMFQKVEDL